MISGIGSSSQMLSQLFSKLDSKSQGYLEKSDLASAFSAISANSSDTTSVDDVFAALDSDSDGKVTESEFAATLSDLQSQLDSQFGQMRMGGMQGQGPQGMGGMPPPPPPENDTGFTQEELTAQLEEIGSTDSKRSELISSIVDNFDAADADGDGKVTFKEAMAFDQSQQTSAATDSSATASTSSTASTDASSELQVMMKLMQLMHVYAVPGDQQTSSLLTATA